MLTAKANAPQVCPVVGATTDHHHNLHEHPSIPDSSIPNATSPTSPIATSCPVLKTAVQDPKAQAMDDAICPVVGTATTILPPDHPSTDNAKEDDVCPVTKATVGHHKAKVHTHPSVATKGEEAVCPVTGQRGAAH